MRTLRSARLPLLLVIFALAFSAVSLRAAPPHVDPANDADNFRPGKSLLFLSPTERMSTFRNITRLMPTRAIHTGEKTLALPRDERNLANFRYSVDGTEYDLAHYVDHNYVVGLLVVQDGKILLEKYTSGNTENTRWISFSVAKSVVSMLMGAAIQDGYIASETEPVTAYLPRLAGSSYDDVTVRDVLQMASGVEWDETYDDPKSDVNQTPGNYLSLVNTLARKPRVAEAGARFNYNTGETNLAGAILRAAIGNNLATYLNARIWQPFGMEHEASWLLDGEGGELGGCCINATLRDYGRLGLFALAGGKLADGTAVLPDDWMARSTLPSKGAPFYGYLWWLQDGGAYAALGIYGQSIYVNPEANLVVATHGSFPSAVGEHFSAHRTAFLRALGDYLR